MKCYFNCSKSFGMLFAPNNFNLSFSFKLLIDNSAISLVQSVKYLGSHINPLVAKRAFRRGPEAPKTVGDYLLKTPTKLLGIQTHTICITNFCYKSYLLTFYLSTIINSRVAESESRVGSRNRFCKCLRVGVGSRSRFCKCAGVVIVFCDSDSALS